MTDDQHVSSTPLTVNEFNHISKEYDPNGEIRICVTDEDDETDKVVSRVAEIALDADGNVYLVVYIQDLVQA